LNCNSSVNFSSFHTFSPQRLVHCVSGRVTQGSAKQQVAVVYIWKLSHILNITSKAKQICLFFLLSFVNK